MSILRGSLAVSLMGLSVMFETCLLETGLKPLRAWTIWPKRSVLRTKSESIVCFTWITDHRHGRRQAESITKQNYKVNDVLNSIISKSIHVRVFLNFGSFCVWKRWKPLTSRFSKHGNIPLKVNIPEACSEYFDALNISRRVLKIHVPIEIRTFLLVLFYKVVFLCGTVSLW